MSITKFKQIINDYLSLYFFYKICIEKALLQLVKDEFLISNIYFFVRTIKVFHPVSLR